MRRQYHIAQRLSAALVTAGRPNKSWFLGGLLLCLLANLLGCSQGNVRVTFLPEPSYPDKARIGNIQGTVEVGMQVGTDGRVLWVHGSGASPVLVEAAEKNARQWIWGPFPPKFEFPWYHEVFYEYKLEGNPASVVIDYATIKTQLPDRIQIIATPFQSDFDVGPASPLSKPKPN